MLSLQVHHQLIPPRHSCTAKLQTVLPPSSAVVTHTELQAGWRVVCLCNLGCLKRHATQHNCWYLLQCLCSCAAVNPHLKDCEVNSITLATDSLANSLSEDWSGRRGSTTCSLSCMHDSAKTVECCQATYGYKLNLPCMCQYDVKCCHANDVTTMPGRDWELRY